MWSATFSLAGLSVLQHVLDQVDAAARAVELVAEEDIGRTGRGAEAAMDAGAEDLLRHRGVGIGELGEGEVRLHRLHARVHPAGIEDALGIEGRLEPPGQIHDRRGLRLEDLDRERGHGRARGPAWRGRRPAPPPRGPPWRRPHRPYRSPRSRPARRPSRRGRGTASVRRSSATSVGPSAGRTEMRQTTARFGGAEGGEVADRLPDRGRRARRERSRRGRTRRAPRRACRRRSATEAAKPSMRMQRPRRSRARRAGGGRRRSPTRASRARPRAPSTAVSSSRPPMTRSSRSPGSARP